MFKIAGVFLYVYVKTAILKKRQCKEQQGPIHGINRLPSLFLPTKKRGCKRMDGLTDQRRDRRTHPHIESWLKTKNEWKFIQDIVKRLSKKKL